MRASRAAVVVVSAALLVAFLAYPAFATSGTTSTPSTTGGSNFRHAIVHRIEAWLASRGLTGSRIGLGGPQAPAFSNGQTISVASTAGSYFVVGTQGKTNGTASGTLTFTVDGKLKAGYILSVSGSIQVAGTTYAITSGSAEMGPGGANIVGQGATSSSGTLIFRASASGNFSGASTSRVVIDFSNGTTEYAIVLTGSIS